MAGVRDRGHYWQIWWLVRQGSIRLRKWEKLSKIDFPKRRDARREAQRREIEVGLLSKEDRSFKDCAMEFLDTKHVAASTRDRCFFTIQSFDNFLSRKHSHIKLKGITETIVCNYINDREINYSPAGINIDLRFLREFFNNSVERGVIKESPMKHIKYLREEKKIKDMPNKEDIQKILGWFRQNTPKFYPWIYFEATRGWRRDELRYLTIDAIDLKGEKLYIRKTKTKEQRVVSLSREDCLVLNEQIILLKKQNLYKSKGYVFPSREGNLVGKNKILELLKRACRAEGITRNITNHSFRHYVVTSILDNTANIELVKAITGHKDTRTILDHYAHPRKEMVEQALRITRVNTGLI